MEEIKQIDKSLSETLRNSDLQGVSANIAEIVIDSMLEEGVLKSLPVVSSIIGIGKTAITVKDQLFLKKIIAFLSGIRDVSQEKRKKMIDLVNESNKEKLKVGEKLIYILDKCDDYVDANYVAQLFTAFLEQRISYQDFLRGSRIIQNIFIGDLEYFLENDRTHFKRTTSSEEAPDEDEFPLINVGILGFGYNPITVEDQPFYETGDRYIVNGGDAVIWITMIGEIIKENLKKEKL